MPTILTADILSIQAFYLQFKVAVSIDQNSRGGTDEYAITNMKTFCWSDHFLNSSSVRAEPVRIGGLILT